MFKNVLTLEGYFTDDFQYGLTSRNHEYLVIPMISSHFYNGRNSLYARQHVRHNIYVFDEKLVAQAKRLNTDSLITVEGALGYQNKIIGMEKYKEPMVIATSIEEKVLPYNKAKLSDEECLSQETEVA